MAAVSWTSAANGEWTVASNWNSDSVPGSGDDAFISVAGSYTVSLTAAITVASITIGDASAVLQIQDPGGDDLVTGNLDSSGSVGVDAIGAGGSTLTVGGVLTNGNYIQVGNSGMTAAALLTADGTFDNAGGVVSLEGGQAGALAQMVLAGAAPGTLTGTYNITGDTGGASLQYGSGQIGTIATGASLLVNGPNAFVADVSDPTTDGALDGLAENDGTLRIINGASVGITGNLLNTGGLLLDGDSFSGEGGSTLTVAGTLTNTDFINIGPPSGNLDANDTLTAGALAGTGSVGLFGSSNQANFDIAAAAPTILTFNLSLFGDSLLQYGSGQIGTIASGISLLVDGTTAFVADASDPTTNSALTGLTENDGTLRIINGASVGITGNLLNAGGLLLDGDSFAGEGGSTLTVAGTLTNTDFINVGPPSGNLTANDTLVASALVGTGSVGLYGSANEAAFDISAAAPAILAYDVSLYGHSLLEYGSGQIGTIASGVSLLVDGPTAFVADASTPTTNSALTGLAENDGTLRIINGASVGIAGNLLNAGGLLLDGDSFSGEGGSFLTVAGTLTNTGFINVGPPSGNLTANTTLVAGALAGTGSVGLFGGASQAIFDIAAAAPNTLAFDLSLFGHSLLQYGSGQIGTIAAGISLLLDGTAAFVADASAPTTNSALTGLTENDGTLRIINGASVGIAGNFLNAGGLLLDGDSFSGEGSSTLTVAGTLTNTGFINVGPPSGNLTANTTLVAGALAGTGSVGLFGGASQAIFDIAAAAPNTLAFDLSLFGHSLLQYGSGQIGTIAAGISLEVDGSNAFVADASDTTTNSALTGLTENDGTLRIINGASVGATGNFLNNGGLLLDGDGFETEGGSTLTVAGTLTNTGFINVGPPSGNLTANTTLVASALAGTGSVGLYGGGTTQAIVGIASAAPTTLSFDLAVFGHSLLQYGSGQIGTIAAGISLEVDGSNAFVADASATTTNSALTGLAENDGTLRIISGASIGITGNFLNNGALLLDGDGFETEGGSTLTVAGTLTNTDFINVGPPSGNLTANTTLVASALAGTGNVSLFGGGTNQAIFDLAAAAPTTLAFNLALFGDSLLEYGSGQVGTIASGIGLEVDGPNAFVTDASAPTTNSALTGLAENDGTLRIINGASVGATGNFLNNGGVLLDGDGFASEGGSTFTVAGTLTNTDFINIGPPSGNLTANTTLIAGDLINSGAIGLYGNTNQAELRVTGTVSNSGAIYVSAGATLAATGSFTQTAGSTQVGGVLSAATIAVAGGAIDLLGGSLEAGGLSLEVAATLVGYGVVAPAITDGGTIEASGGTLDLAGGLATSAPMAIENAAALDLAGADSSNVAFVGGSGIFELGDPIGFTGTIIGLGIGDTLVLDNTQATGATASYDSSTDTSTLAVTIAGGGTLDFTLAGDYAGDAFGANQVGNATQIAAVGAAVGQINTPLPVALGTVRQGAGASVPLSITNNAPSGSAALDVTIGAVTGGATGSGTIIALPAGITDAIDIRVGIGSGLAGVQSGTVTLDFASVLSGGNAAPLPSESVPVSGTVYREAIADITPLTLYAHVGDPGVETLDLTNIAPADGYSEALIAALTGATGNFGVADAGPTGDIAPGGTTTATLGLSFSTAQAGVISGDALVSLTSDGGTGAGSIDGLGTISLGTETVPISISIDNYATAEIQGPTDFGTLTSVGNAATLDLGTIAENTGSFGINFGVVNGATGPADLLSGSFVATAANGFALTSLGAFSGLAVGQATADTVTLDTSVNGVISQTITLDPTDSAGSFTAPLTPQTLTITGTVEPLPSPIITAAPTLTAMTDVPVLVGVSIADPNTDTLPLTVTVTDASGSLTADVAGTATVSGDGSNMLTLTGDVTDLNEELDTLAYSAPAVGADTIDITVEDQHHASASEQIAVEAGPVPFTVPVINSPANVQLIAGTPTGVGGYSISDPSAQAAGTQVTFDLSLPGGDLTLSGPAGPTITGQGTSNLSITGTVGQINADFSDGLFAVLTPDAGLFGAITDSLANVAAAASGGSAATTIAQVAAFEQLVGTIAPALDQIYDALTDDTAGSLIDLAFELGDAHITTFSGDMYDFNASGEFILAKSTRSGDTFQVQVRLQPYEDSSSGTVMTQVAALVGTDRVTFAINRPDTVWVNGSPETLTDGQTVDLTGGQLTQSGANAYVISWNTGEELEVVNNTSYLDTTVGLGAGDGPGSVEGLMGPDQGQANDFMLPNGTVLSQPLTTDQLYNTFGAAWEVTAADSLMDYASGQSAASFPLTPPLLPLTLADLPANVVAQAASIVAEAGITNPAAVAAAEYDYLVTGDVNFVATDAAATQTASPTTADATPSSTPVALGIYATETDVAESPTSATPVVFDLYLTSDASTATTVDWTVFAPDSTTDFAASSFGGSFPSGQVTIAAGQTTGQFTVTLPVGAIGDATSENLDVQISDPGGPPVFGGTAQTMVTGPTPGAPPVPELEYLGTLGTFTQDGNNYTLDLGAVQVTQILPQLLFSVENAATAPADQLGGTFTVETVTGFTVSGAALPSPIDPGDSYSGLTVTANEDKFGDNSETITFNPIDTNPTGYSSTLPPLTLTIADTLELPSMVYSEAWGDVHIITYNQLAYNFQQVGEFVLAESRIPGDNFEIQMRLQPLSPTSIVSVITQVAIQLGPDSVTFDWTRANTVEIDGGQASLSQADPTIVLQGGTITEVSPSMYKVAWDTGETMTVTNGGPYDNIIDGIPGTALPGSYGGLQGEDEGQSNDFQLPDGTVLAQPISTSTLYGEYSDAWRVSPQTSLFNYPTGESTLNFTDYNFPADVLNLSDLPASVVAQAAAMVAAAGIVDPTVAQDAEYDYLASGNPAFITGAVAIQDQVTPTTAATVTPPAVTPEIGVAAVAQNVTLAASGMTPVTFDAYLTGTESTDTVVDYAVVAPGAGYFGASAFGGTLPSGQVTIVAGQTLVPITIDVPQDALGSLPSDNLEVQVSDTAGISIFAPTAQTAVDNDVPTAGNPAIPEFGEISGGGTFSFDASTHTYTLDLGTLAQNSTQNSVVVAVINAATAPADSVGGAFTAPLGSGFLVTGDYLTAPVPPGQNGQQLTFTVQTGTVGANSLTLSLDPADVNDSGYSAPLTPITLTVEDTVVAPGVGQLNTPQTIVFPNVHVGTSESEALSVSNTGAAPISVSVAATDPITAQGSIAALAPGASDTTALLVGVNTSNAGALGGPVDVNFGSSDPTVDVFGDVFRLASGTIAPVTDYVHVGDAGTIAVGITNTATADGYSENLLASLASVTQGVGTIGIASAGPTGEIAAGGSNTSSLLLDFSTAQTGTISGTVTVGLTSDGGTGAGSIDGLGTTALPSQMAPVSITVDNYANPVFENVSDIGTFAQNGTAYSLNLGTIDQGSAPFVVDLGVLNDVTGPADTASGTLGASGSSAFTTSGLGAFDLGAGQADIAPMVTLATGNTGVFTETITLAATGSNAGGYSAALPGETLTVTGTISAAPGGIGEPAPAIASVVPSGTIDFGAVHVDGTAQESLSISNTATAGAASLDGSVSGVTGAATANGSFTGLAPGAPASTAIDVGINTGVAGAQSGTVDLAFVSDAGTLGVADLPSQSITVTGSVYREAAAALLPISEIVHVGNPGTAFISVSNSDPADNYSESLIAALIGTSGSIGIASGGPTGDILAGTTNTSALAVSFSTAQAGTISGTGTIELTSDGGIGPDSIDNLGTTALGDETVPVSITVDNYAVAELTSDGNLTANGSDAFTLNLGTATEGGAALSANLNVLNDVLGPADWLSGTLGVSGSSQFDNSGFGTFGTIVAGGSLDAGSVSLATNQLGVFDETLVLTPMDTNADGFFEVLAAQTVTVTGTIVPTGVAQGDVHMVTFDGLHYDFQADGAFVLTRSTVPGDNFQIQIQTAPDAADHAVSYTTEAAAQVGSDVVTFAIDRASTVWVDGTPDTTLSGADPVQTFDGGQLQELSSNSFLLTWATGQTLTITDQGSHLDSSVGLGAANGPGSVQGLLGSDSGQANDFQLPDGTVLQQPLSGQELYGTFADAWSVTPADSLLDGAATTGWTDPTVGPVVIGTTDAGTMQFIYANGTSGQTALQADAPGQVLSAASGVNILSDAGGFGATFQGTLAEFAHELIAGFSAKDVIDVTDLSSATASVSYAGSDSEGVLYLTDGTQSGELYLSGSLAGGNFHVSSDGHGGTEIAFS